jgi:hypothetical protein
MTMAKGDLQGTAVVPDIANRGIRSPRERRLHCREHSLACRIQQRCKSLRANSSNTFGTSALSLHVVKCSKMRCGERPPSGCSRRSATRQWGCARGGRGGGATTTNPQSRCAIAFRTSSACGRGRASTFVPVQDFGAH